MLYARYESRSLRIYVAHAVVWIRVASLLYRLASMRKRTRKNERTNERRNERTNERTSERTMRKQTSEAHEKHTKIDARTRLGRPQDAPGEAKIEQNS